MGELNFIFGGRRGARGALFWRIVPFANHRLGANATQANLISQTRVGPPVFSLKRLQTMTDWRRLLREFKIGQACDHDVHSAVEITMRRLSCIMVCAVLCGPFTFALGAESPQPATVIEISQPKPSAGFIGTVGDTSTKQERPFQAKVTERPINHWAGLDVPLSIVRRKIPRNWRKGKRSRRRILRNRSAAYYESVLGKRETSEKNAAAR